MTSTAVPPRVGFARLPLAVEPGMPLGGYADRTGPATGTLDPLHVSAVAIAHQGRIAVICVADVPVVNLDVAEAARTRIAATIGTSADLVWLTATHTHAGPETGCRVGGAATPTPWAELLPRLATEAAAQALAAAVASDLTLHHGELTGIGGQRAGARRRPTVPAAALCAREPASGALLGMLAVLAVHPTVLEARNRLASADLNGAVRRALTAQIGPESVWCAVATGAAGDISTRPHRRAQTTAELERLGRLGAAQLLELAARPPVARLDVQRPLTGAGLVLQLYGRPPVDPRERDALLSRLRSRAEAARNGGDAIAAREAATAVQGAEIAIRVGPHDRRVACAVNALDLGGLKLIGLGGEPYSALDCRTRTALTGGVLVGYANGYCGYLPTRDAFSRDDYEVLMSPIAAGEGERALEAAIGLVIHSNPGRP